MDRFFSRLLLCVALCALVVYLLSTTPSRAAATKETRIIALLSHNTAPYQEALAGFQQYLGTRQQAAIEVLTLNGNDDHNSAVWQKIKTAKVDLLFTLGSLATRAVLQMTADTPVIAGLILDSADLNGAANATAVVLEFAPETELQWLQRFLPASRTIGVLFNPDENQEKIAQATAAAQRLGLTLIEQAVQMPRDLPEALERLSTRVDVLWGIPDRTVLSPQTAEPVLLFSFRHSIPFAGLSMSWAKAGALYALDRDYLDVGVQCGELAGKVLSGTPPSALPPVRPRKIRYALNLKTAQHMKVDLPDDLIRGADWVFP